MTISKVYPIYRKEDIEKAIREKMSFFDDSPIGLQPEKEFDFSIEDNKDGTSSTYMNNKIQIDEDEWSIRENNYLLISNCLQNVKPFSEIKDIDNYAQMEEDYLIFISELSENIQSMITEKKPGNSEKTILNNDGIELEDQDFPDFSKTVSAFQDIKKDMEEDAFKISLGKASIVHNKDLNKAISELYPSSNIEKTNIEGIESLQNTDSTLYITKAKINDYKNHDYSLIFESSQNQNSLVPEIIQKINSPRNEKNKTKEFNI